MNRLIFSLNVIFSLVSFLVNNITLVNSNGYYFLYCISIFSATISIVCFFILKFNKSRFLNVSLVFLILSIYVMVDVSSRSLSGLTLSGL